MTAKPTPIKTILVIDDDTDILESLRIMLSFHGFNVRTSNRGDTAFDAGNTFDLLLLDVWLSGENGVDICQALKADKRTAHLPVILLSASKDLDRTAEKAGADDYIEKPFEMKSLMASIQKNLAMATNRSGD